MNKIKDLKNLSKSDRAKKIKELKVEIMKVKSGAQKTGNSKIKQIKKTIARILTIEKMEEKQNGNLS